MVFSSQVFLFLFLPVLLSLHFVCPHRWRNALLLAASLLFYAWGGPTFLLLMLASISGNYLFGLWLDRIHGQSNARWVLALAITANLSALGYFKYAGFLAGVLQTFVSPLGIELPHLRKIELPIGISFFTFHAISYLIDIYRGVTRVQRRPANLALYVSLFPQLVAGPIVRYRDVAEQILSKRQITVEQFATGVQRFVIGLAKKLLLANAVGQAADAVFGLPAGELTGPVAWLGVASYSLQIYFDFSGYSDMAVGLGMMFGFRFLENFNYPYISRSVTEFWRRWHISLSTWFRDYLYVPLGGNRLGPRRTYVNLLVVFLLCGLWHGASWNFIVWGLFHGCFLVLERSGWGRMLERAWAPLAHLYTLTAVAAGWVFFRADNLPHAMAVLQAMCGLGHSSGAGHSLRMFLDSGLVLTLSAGVFAAVPWLPALQGHLARLHERLQHRPGIAIVLDGLLATARVTALAGLLFAASANVTASTYNPFIYFRF